MIHHTTAKLESAAIHMMHLDTGNALGVNITNPERQQITPTSPESVVSQLLLNVRVPLDVAMSHAIHEEELLTIQLLAWILQICQTQLQHRQRVLPGVPAGTSPLRHLPQLVEVQTVSNVSDEHMRSKLLGHQILRIGCLLMLEIHSEQSALVVLQLADACCVNYILGGGMQI